MTFKKEANHKGLEKGVKWDKNIIGAYTKEEKINKNHRTNEKIKVTIIWVVKPNM